MLAGSPLDWSGGATADGNGAAQMFQMVCDFARRAL